MAKIFVSDESGLHRKWQPLDDITIAGFLGNPVMTGEVYLHNPAEPILEEVTDRTSHEQFNAYMNGVHIATNYGLAVFYRPGTTHIVPPGRNPKGYAIIQLTDMVVDFDKFDSKSQRPNLTANPLKMSGAGRTYRIDGTFEEVVDELRGAYQFVGPGKEETSFPWLMRMREIVEKQREGKVTDEFVDYVNKNYFSEFQHRPATKQEVVEHFQRKFCL